MGPSGVPKGDKVTPGGLPILRLIMDLRATNYCMRQIEGDVSHLTGATTFQRLLVEIGEDLLISGEDLTSAFYLFRLPAVWSDYMVLGAPVAMKDLGLPGDGETLLGVSVLPMGWHSAVGLMQAVHRTIALRSVSEGGAGLRALAEVSKTAEFPSCDEDAVWNIYLDDTTILERVDKALTAELEGTPAEEQEKLRAAYAWWGIPINASKSLERASQAERLGALIDGKTGTLRTRSKRSLDLFGLGSWIRSCTEFRRCLFAVMDEIFVAIARSGNSVVVTPELAEEMMMLETLLPLAQFNLRAKVDPVVTCSDASEYGGGMCFSSRLTRTGQEEAERMILEGIPPEPGGHADTGELQGERILVVDLFAGIGGLEIALEKAGVKVHHSIMVEKDVYCRTLLRRKFPGSDFCSDIRKFNEGLLKKALDKVPGITGILVGGGSPCQGLSQLSSERKHLDDERSGLFYEAVRVMELVQDVAAARKIWVLKFLENVVADEEDVNEMSAALGIHPVMVESGKLSRVRRPRLYLDVHRV
eukprot:s5330_g2.t1